MATGARRPSWPSPRGGVGDVGERGTGAGIRLGDRRMGRLAARTVPRHGPVPRHRRAPARSPWPGRPGLGRRGLARSGRPAFRCPSMPPSRPAAARAPSVSRPCIVRYTCVCDTLTYRIRLRILAGAVKRRNTSSARSTPGLRATPDPGRQLMFERLGSWTYRFRFLILIAWIVGGGLHGRGRPEPVGPGVHGPDHLPAGELAVAHRQGRHRASLPREHVLVVGDHHDGPPGRADRRGPGLARRVRRLGRERRGARASSASAVTDTATADSRPELEELFRAARRHVRAVRDQPQRRGRGRRGQGRRRASPRAPRRFRARWPRDPRHGRRGHQLRLPRGGPGRHGQHHDGHDHPRHPRAAGDLPGAARRPHPAGHHRRRVRGLAGRARLPGCRRLAGLLHPGDLPRGHGVRGRDRLRDLPDQPLPRRGVARRRLARRGQDHGQAHRRGHHRVGRHGDRRA